MRHDVVPAGRDYGLRHGTEPTGSCRAGIYPAGGLYLVNVCRHVPGLRGQGLGAPAVVLAVIILVCLVVLLVMILHLIHRIKTELAA